MRGPRLKSWRLALTYQWSTQNAEFRYHGANPSAGVGMSVCVYCGSEIKTDFPSQALERKYCNRECYRRGTTQEMQRIYFPASANFVRSR